MALKKKAGGELEEALVFLQNTEALFKYFMWSTLVTQLWSHLAASAYINWKCAQLTNKLRLDLYSLCGMGQIVDSQQSPTNIAKKYIID